MVDRAHSVAFNFVLGKAVGNSVPSGPVRVRMEDVENPLASTNKFSGLEKSMTYNGLVVALHCNRFNSSNACGGPASMVWLALVLQSNQLTVLQFLRKSQYIHESTKKTQNLTKFSFRLRCIHLLDDFDLLTHKPKD